MSNKGIRKLHELDNTVSYEELQAELDTMRNERNLALKHATDFAKTCKSQDAEIDRLKGLLKRAKPTSINGGKADLFLEITEALKGEPHD